MQNRKRDYAVRGDTTENNSNSSFHDQEHVYQDSSPQASYDLQQNGHYTHPSNTQVSKKNLCFGKYHVTGN